MGGESGGGGAGGGGVEQDGGGVAAEFATAKSGFPSPLMSPMLTEYGASARREVDLGGESGGGGVGGGGIEQDGGIAAAVGSPQLSQVSRRR